MFGTLIRVVDVYQSYDFPRDQKDAKFLACSLVAKADFLVTGDEDWYTHFRWSEDGLRIIGVTAIGRATVATLHLSDDPDTLVVRSYSVMAGWHPPSE